MGRCTSTTSRREAETGRFARDDRNGRVIYLSTFSKTLAPGFRVGWVVAAPCSSTGSRPPSSRSTSRQASSISALRMKRCAAVCWSGWRQRLRARYRLKRDVMETAIRVRWAMRLTWRTPKGGFFLWATLPAGCTDTDLTLARARAAGGVRHRQRVLRERRRARHASGCRFRSRRLKGSRRAFDGWPVSSERSARDPTSGRRRQLRR